MISSESFDVFDFEAVEVEVVETEEGDGILCDDNGMFVNVSYRCGLVDE